MLGFILFLPATVLLAWVGIAAFIEYVIPSGIHGILIYGAMVSLVAGVFVFIEGG